MCPVCQVLDVQDGKGWVGGCFTIHQHAGFAQAGFQLVLLVLQQEGYGNAQRLTVVYQQFLSTAIQVTHTDNAFLPVGQQRGGNGRHTRGKSESGPGVFKRRQALLKFANAGIGAPARIKIALCALFNNIQQCLSVREPVGSGVVHRRIGTAKGILMAAVMDDSGGFSLSGYR